MKYTLLLILISSLSLPLRGQSSLIKKSNTNQRTKLIKSVVTPKGKYLPQGKVDKFFTKKQANYVLVETKQTKDFFYGASVKDQVTSIDYIVKRDLKGDKNYYLKKGINHFENDAAEKSLESFETAIALGSRDVRAYLGIVHFDYQNDSKKCRQYLDIVRREGPKNLSPYWKRVYFHMNAFDYNAVKQYNTALGYAKKVLKVKEEDNTSVDYSNVGYVYQNLGKKSDYLSSIPYFETALQKTPNQKEVLLNLGFSYFKTEQFVKANAIFEKTRTTQPTKKFTYPINDLCNYYQGVSNVKLGNMEKAVHQLNLFLNKQPKHGYADDAYFFTGLAYIQLQEKEKLRTVMINAANLGHKKAIEFSAQYLAGTKWYAYRKKRESDEMLAKAMMPMMNWLIEDSINQFFRDMEGPTEEEWKRRGEAAQENMRQRRRPSKY